MLGRQKRHKFTEYISTLEDPTEYITEMTIKINLKLNYQFFCDGQYQNNEFTFDGNFIDSVGYADSYK